VKLVRECRLLLFQVTHRNDLLAHRIMNFPGQKQLVFDQREEGGQVIEVSPVLFLLPLGLGGLHDCHLPLRSP
jgi:hypothetical protein